MLFFIFLFDLLMFWFEEAKENSVFMHTNWWNKNFSVSMTIGTYYDTSNYHCSICLGAFYSPYLLENLISRYYSLHHPS